MMVAYLGFLIGEYNLNFRFLTFSVASRSGSNCRTRSALIENAATLLSLRGGYICLQATPRRRQLLPHGTVRY